MTPTFRRLGPSELFPRYIFAEHLFARRRVLEIGAIASTQGASAEFLVRRGARAVVACDDDVAAVEAARHRLSRPELRYRTLVFDDLEPQSFDLILVADLTPYVHAPELMRQLVRLVAKNGYLVGGLRNLAGLALAQVMDPEEGTDDSIATYGQLLDALSPHFPAVEVATQSPLLGYQLAFESGEGLEVDGSLAPSAEAAYFVVVAGHEKPRGFEPTWVQLPPEPLAFTRGRLEEHAARTRNWEERAGKLRDVSEKLRGELATREAELDSLRRSHEEAESEVARVRAQLERLERDGPDNRLRDELTASIRRKEAQLEAVEERVGQAERQKQEARAELLGVKKAHEELVQALRSSQDSLRLETARTTELTTALEAAKTRVERAGRDAEAARDEAGRIQLALEEAKLREAKAHEDARSQLGRVEEFRGREDDFSRRASSAETALETLRAELTEARAATVRAESQWQEKVAEHEAALRAAEVARQKISLVEAEMTRLQAETDVALASAAGREAVENELRSAESERESLRAEATEQASRLGALERDLAETHTRLTETLATVAERGALISKLEESLHAAEERSARAEYSRLQAETLAESERGSLETRLAEGEARVEEERAKAQARFDSEKTGLLLRHAAALAASQAALRASEQESALAHASFESLQQEYHSAKGSWVVERESAKRKTEVLEEQLAAARIETAALQSAHESLKAERDAFKASSEESEVTRGQLEAARAELAALREDRERLQREFDLSSDERSALQRALEAGRQGSSDLQRELDVERARNVTTQALLDAATARENELVGASDSARAQVQTAIDAAKSEQALLKASLDQAAESEASLRQSLRDERSRREGTQKELEQAQAHELALRAKHEKLQAEHAASEAALERACDETAELRGKLKELESLGQEFERTKTMELQAVRSELVEKGSTFDEERATLRQDIDSLKTHLETVQASLAGVTAQRNKLQTELEPLQAVAKALTHERDELRTQVETDRNLHNEVLGAERIRADEAQVAWERATLDARAAKAESEALGEQLAELQRTFETSAASHAAEIHAATQALDSARSSQSQHGAELQTEVGYLQDTLAAERQERETLLSSHALQVARLERDIEGARAAYDALEHERAAVSSATSTSELASLQAELEARTAEKEALETVLSTLTAERDELRASLGHAEAKLRVLESADASAASELEQAKESLVQSAENEIDLRAQRDQFARLLHDADAEREVQRQEIEALRAEHERLVAGKSASTEHPVTETMHVSEEALASMPLDGLEDVRLPEEALADALDEQQRYNQRLEKMAEGLEDELGAIRAALESTREQLYARESELDTLRRAGGSGRGVTEIYERASAELSAVKAGLKRTPTSSGTPVSEAISIETDLKDDDGKDA